MKTLARIGEFCGKDSIGTLYMSFGLERRAIVYGTGLGRYDVGLTGRGIGVWQGGSHR